MELKDIAIYAKDRVEIKDLSALNYISTENMMPEKGGVQKASSLPSIPFTSGFIVNDVLISNIRPYFRKIWFADKEGGCSNDVLVFRAKERCYPKFLYYVLCDNRFFDYSTASAKGTKMPRGDKSAIMEYKVPNFDIFEQIKIANILSSLDDKIALNQRINDNLEQQAQALYRSWFIDFEPFKGGKFIDSELGEIPEGWRVGKLIEIADIIMGQSPQGSSFNEIGDGIIFYQGRTEFGERFPSIRLYTTEPSRFAEPLSVLLSVRAPVGDINIASRKCCIGRGLASIKSKKAHYSFLFYTMQSLKPLLDKFNGEGTVFGSINRSSLENMTIVIPPNDIIERFEKITQKIDMKILNFFNESNNLKDQRDILLPKLMSGELKINDLHS